MNETVITNLVRTLESASLGSPDFDMMIHKLLNPRSFESSLCPFYTMSVDEAMKVAPDGWTLALGEDEGPIFMVRYTRVWGRCPTCGTSDVTAVSAQGDTAAMAICVAALQAHIAELTRDKNHKEALQRAR